VYQVDEDFITKCLREIRLSTLNAGLSLPILGLSLYSGSTAGVVVAVLAAILGIRAALRIISLASMPTKVTVAWPVNKTHVSNSLMEMLNLDSADESVESSFGELEYRSEMSQMAEHNQAEQLNEEAKKSKEAMKAKVQADAKNKIDARYGRIAQPHLTSCYELLSALVTLSLQSHLFIDLIFYFFPSHPSVARWPVATLRTPCSPQCSSRRSTFAR